MNREDLLIQFAKIKDLVNTSILYNQTGEEYQDSLIKIQGLILEVFTIEDMVDACTEA